MQLTKFEIVGIALSVACMATALWLLNLDTNTNRIARLQGTEQTAVVVNADQEQTVALTEALTEAGARDGSVERLVIDDVIVGSGQPVAVGDTVTVHYKGALTNGVIFDDSYTRGTPFTFTVGAGRVIQGWEQGIVGMRVGGQRVLVVPSELGYGRAGGGPIPPDATLVFTIELLSIE